MYEIRRFPIEPVSVYFEPTSRNINSGGLPSYNAMPINSRPVGPDPYNPDYIDGGWYEGD